MKSVPKTTLFDTDFMTYNPLSEIIDEQLLVNDQTIQELLQLKRSEKFTDLPGLDTVAERARLSKPLNDLLDKLIEGVTNNPSKLWVMSEFQQALEVVEMEDTEARERFGTYLERIMDILAIESSDGLLSFYL